MFGLSLKHFDRYRQIAGLLYRHGRSDLVQQSGLLGEVGEVSESSDGEKSKPEQLAEDLESMGPAFVKLGQLLSTRPDILPPPYLDALSRLQDDAEQVPYEDICEVVQSELGAKPDTIFQSFQRDPLACASLGQVHRAVLRDGTGVVVKIQRPGIVEPLADDLEALCELADFLEDHTDFGREFQLKQLTASLQSSLQRELNYVQEAQSAIRLANNLQQHPRVQIPQPIQDLTSRRVLTMEYVSGAKVTDLSEAVLIELDRNEIAEDLFRCYLQQVLVDGLFHADPHPGNLSLTPDHRIALMDFGLVARFDPATREQIVKLVLAVAEGDGDAASRFVGEIGEPTDDYDEQSMRSTVRSVVADNYASSMQQLSLGQTMMKLQRAAGQNGLILPEEVLLLGKTLLNLDRTVMTLAPDFKPNDAVRRNAHEIVARHGQEKLSLAAIFQAVMETAEFAQELPSRANKLMKMAAENELRIKVDSIDEQGLLKGIHKVANRITAGLIVASMIVGASLIMRLETDWEIMGYPALAAMFFLAAAVAGGYLFWQAVVVDEA